MSRRQRPSQRQHARLLEAIRQLQRCRSLDDFPEVVNSIFSNLIACDSVSYNDVYPDMNRLVYRLDPTPPDVAHFATKWKQHGYQHPVINYVRETGDGSAHQISDFISHKEYHALELYQDCYREMGVEYQMAISVSVTKDVIVGVAMNRQMPEFSETDRMLANLLRPHVCEAYLTVLELRHLRGMVDDLSSMLDEEGEGVVFWSHQGIILRASPLAQRLLGACFGWRGGRELPEPLAAWARKALTTEEGALDDRFSYVREDRRLIARLARRSEFHYLTILLREEPASPAPLPLTRLGISKREAEILGWIAAGKSNLEIAQIAGVSPLTVKTHVVKIFRKLGVENRTSAAAIAHDFLRAGWIKS